MTAPPALLALVLLAPLLAGCNDECAPTDFGGGRACGDEAGLIESCQFVECLEGPFCVERWVVDEQYCPATLPACVSVAPGEVYCEGERIGPCSTAGFVRCEGPLVQVLCLEDPWGTLELHRGSCAAGARCYDSGEDEQPGCQPSF